ncbi:helix-turn-helix transcriptional regulator [Vibrio marisflavi]|uniref:DNA-binding protein n=1 Tax=Vibrio marisflavi CECT 7928 TaxID=634439 RepID=A0ABN8ECM3_9VIBR|nr:hypothetical protein [Vibrio marisflavi]CAH0543126.1 hypothetical protein VMF7928_04413 [Vibrio marisflavi CECT 7928]
MKEFEFALVASSLENITVENGHIVSDAIYEAGADDCTVTSKGNTLIIDFIRESDNYETAVLSAIAQVSQVETLTIKSVDAGQYVGLSDAAELSNLTRSALSKFSKGERGDGTFPTPFLRVQGKAPLYDWAEIARWLEAKGLVESGIAENARITGNINMALKLQHGELEEVSRYVSLIQ